MKGVSGNTSHNGTVPLCKRGFLIKYHCDQSGMLLSLKCDLHILCVSEVASRYAIVWVKGCTGHLWHQLRPLASEGFPDRCKQHLCVSGSLAPVVDLQREHLIPQVVVCLTPNTVLPPNLQLQCASVGYRIHSPSVV